jgi:hypothetical protein
MKTVWTDAYGNRFDSYEEVDDDAYEKMDWDDLSEFFHNYVGFTELLKWASKQENFWGTYEDDMTRARGDYIAEHYWEEEVDDEENCDGECSTCGNYDCPLITNEDS